MRSKLALGSLFLLFLFFTCNHFFSIFPFFFLISFPIFSFLFLSFIFHYINQLPYQYAWIYQAFITDDTIFSIAPATTSHYPLSLVLLFFFSLSLSHSFYQFHYHHFQPHEVPMVTFPILLESLCTTSCCHYLCIFLSLEFSKYEVNLVHFDFEKIKAMLKWEKHPREGWIRFFKNFFSTKNSSII